MRRPARWATDHRDRVIEIGSQVGLLTIAKVDQAFRGGVGTVVGIKEENVVAVRIVKAETIKQSKLLKVVALTTWVDIFYHAGPDLLCILHL